MSNVLLVTYIFPPSGGVGVPRALAYARYLTQNNCKLRVITTSKPATPVYDPDLLRLVPEDVSVIRALNLEPPFAWRDRLWKRLAPPHRTSGNGRPVTCGHLSRIKAWLRNLMQRALFPDIQTLWAPFATRAAIREIEKCGADTVILNVPPFSTLKIGIELKKRFPAIKLIADFRDEWLGYYAQQFDSPDDEKLKRARVLERSAVECSDYVSLATSSWAQRVRDRYPDQPAAKFVVTTNGFDPREFDTFQPVRRNDGKFVITYFGTTHNNRVYSPDNYLSALERLPEEIRGAIETRFIGRITPDAEPLLRNRGTAISTYGFAARNVGLGLLQESDILLLIATDPTSHAAKLFDYLATGIPILALSSVGGEIDQLIKQTGTGVCIDPANVDAIGCAVRRFFELSKSGMPLHSPNRAAIDCYAWPTIMKNLAERTGIGSGPERQSVQAASS